MNSSSDNNFMTLLSLVLGEALRTKVRGIPTPDIPIYVFYKYDKSNKNRIEAQVCNVLEKAGLVAHHSERFIWLDIRNLLFCQAFLVKDSGQWYFNEHEMNGRKLSNCWKRFDKASMLDLFVHQWQFLERITHGRMDNEQRKRFKDKELLKRLLIKYAQVYHDELSFIRKHQPRENSYLPLADNSGAMVSRSVSMEGSAQHCFCDKFKEKFHKDFREDSRENFVKQYFEEFNQNEYLLPLRSSNGWLPQMHLDFYLTLLSCVGKQSISKLMQDLTSDFKQWGAGMPDIIVYDKESNQYMLLECKGPKDKLKDSQIRWFKRNEDFYHFNVAFVVTSEKQINKL